MLGLADGRLINRMVVAERGADVADLRLVPLADDRVVLVTDSDASFFPID